MRKPIFANPEIEKEYQWLKSKDKKRLIEIYGGLVMIHGLTERDDKQSMIMAILEAEHGVRRLGI